MDARPDTRWLRLILPVAALLVTLGWAEMWFVCDDAYISFRAIANRREGWGYTWNPPPFAPVEGYTSFLWVVLLDAIWSVTGVAPPAASTVVGLIAAYASVGITAWMAWQVPLPEGFARWRPAGLALVLLGLVTNKSFLVWTSSGLEIPLFVALHLGWYAWAVFAPRGRGWVVGGAWLCLALIWTRPDGLLHTAGAVALVAWTVRGGRRLQAVDLAALLPVALFFVHVGWRRMTYGVWLPNTWYAKVAEPWLAGGGNHFWLYVVEYGWFFWLIPAVGMVYRRRQRGVDLMASPGLSVAIAVTVTYLGYYIYKVGGDHFEFRIYAHVPSLMLLGMMWLLPQLVPSPRRASAALLLLISSTWVIPWTDWWGMRPLRTAVEIKKLHLTVADRLPPPLSWWGGLHDHLEGWCTSHILAIPHQTHKWFRLITAEKLPTRAEAMELFPKAGWDADATGKRAFPIEALPAVGVAAWRAPYVAIIDMFGLNDQVIARNLPPYGRFRYAAHDRFPPPDYVECFEPNVDVFKKLALRRRAEPMTPERIVACEAAGMVSLPRAMLDANVDRAALRALRALQPELEGELIELSEPMPAGDGARAEPAGDAEAR